MKLRSDPYGVGVHRHLAALSLAGHITLEETPTGHVVVEYMQPTVGEQPGWITLFKFGPEFKSRAVAYRDASRGGLDQFLEALETKSFAHGDLCSDNILIEVNVQDVPRAFDGPECIRLVDFD